MSFFGSVTSTYHNQVIIVIVHRIVFISFMKKSHFLHFMFIDGHHPENSQN